MEAAGDPGKIKGWVFSSVCVLVFLMPIITAILGSMLFSSNQTYGLLGGLAGFLFGAFISALITRIAGIESR